MTSSSAEADAALSWSGVFVVRILARVPLLTVFSAAVLLFVGSACQRSTPPSDVDATSGEPGETRAAAPADTAETLSLDMTRTSLGRGGTLNGALEKLGLADELRPAVIEELGRHLDLRRLPPQTGLTLARDESGVSRRICCRAATGEFTRVKLGDGATLTAERIPVPVHSSVSTAVGFVETTVAGALSGYPDAVKLTNAFADVFQWDVDLFVDPRPGDRVLLVYETHRLGTVPGDIPTFGKTSDEAGAYLGVGRILAASYEGRRASSTAFWVADDGRGGGYYDAEGNSLRKTFLKSPLNYRRISSGFSRARRHPITRRVVPHHGVDFVAPGGTPVVASADGRVVSAGWDGALGRAVRVRHGNGYVSVYGHLRGFARGIRRGAEVSQNQVIGYVGATGRATGPHLHYTLMHHGRAINPMTFHNPPTGPLDPSRAASLREAVETWTPVLHLAASGSPPTGIARSSSPIRQADAGI